MNKFAALAMPLLALAAPATAAQIYNAPNGLAGNQAWSGTLGLDFAVNAPIRVTSIGVFDADANGLNATLAVTIFDTVTQTALFTPVIFTAGTANTGGAYIFQTIAPVFLSTGTYQLAAWNYDWNEMNYNNSGPGGPITFNSFGGRITALGTSYANSGGVFATNGDTGLTRYGAGSFIATVPEPAQWALMLGGFGLLGASMRRRRTAVVYS